MTTITAIIGIDVFLSDGTKVSARDFTDTPRVGYGVEMFHDFGYKCIPMGDAGECVSGVCPIK